MISFYSWTHADKFLGAWREAGFRVIGHLVFRKQYCSQTRFLGYQHEQAYLLAKGQPKVPAQPISDVVDMRYSGNHMHPTQKSLRIDLPGGPPSSGPLRPERCGGPSFRSSSSDTARGYNNPQSN